MPKPTLRDTYIKALVKRGYSMVKETSKYKVFAHPDAPDKLYYIGKSGSIRVGANVAGSIPASTKFKMILQAEAEANET